MRKAKPEVDAEKEAIKGKISIILYIIIIVIRREESWG